MNLLLSFCCSSTITHSGDFEAFFPTTYNTALNPLRLHTVLSDYRISEPWNATFQMPLPFFPHPPCHLENRVEGDQRWVGKACNDSKQHMGSSLLLQYLRAIPLRWHAAHMTQMQFSLPKNTAESRLHWQLCTCSVWPCESSLTHWDFFWFKATHQLLNLGGPPVFSWPRSKAGGPLMKRFFRLWAFLSCWGLESV